MRAHRIGRRIPKPSRLVLVAMATAVALAGADLEGHHAQAGQRPDIIIVMVDDHGYIPNQRVLRRLPAIKRVFLDGGMRFRHLYNETPLCCPARANLLTGQHTLRHGVTKNDGDLLDPRRTIAVALQAAGYQTLMVGKYFNAYDGDRHPPGWDRISMFLKDPDRLIDLSSRWLKEAPTDAPVFAWLSASAPHREQGSRHPRVSEEDKGAAACKGIAPFKPPTYRTWSTRQPPPRNMPNWPNGWKLRTICESLLSVDRLVRAVVNVQADRDRPAWFLFLSDNGMAFGQKGFAGKNVPLSTRLPAYMAGPGIAGGTNSDQLLSIIDVAPTLAELAATELPWVVDGRSFVPLLRGQPFAGRSALLEIQTAGKLRWKAIRLPRWRYIRWASGKRELYRNGRDEWERVNLVDRKTAKARKLDTRLKRLVRRSRG